MSATTLPTYISLRSAAGKVHIPGAELLAMLHERGAEVLNMGSAASPRYRVRESDVLDLLRSRRQPTPEETAQRADVIEQMAAERVLARRAGGGFS